MLYTIPIVTLLIFALGGAWVIVKPRLRQAPLRRIAGPAPESFLKGNVRQFYDTKNWAFHGQLLKVYGRVVRVFGLMGDTRLYVSDPRALHTILVKDTDIWEKEAGLLVVGRLVEGVNITSTTGAAHRRHRKLLTPAFSINHMRLMMPIFARATDKFIDILRSKAANGTAEIDVLEWMSRLALELVGQGSLGYSFGTLNENSNNAYAEALKMIAPALVSVRVFWVFLPLIANIGMPSFWGAVARLVPWKTLQDIIGMIDALEAMSVEILDAKKRALEKDYQAVAQETAEGKDIMSILLRANMFAPPGERIPESELLAEMSGLIFAGMDTTSSALSRTLQLLSENPDIQDELRRELVQAFENKEELDYDELHDLPFLDAVCRETLRLYPPVPYLIRTARQDTILPLSSPIVDTTGASISQLSIPANTDVIIGMFSVNRDPQIWGPDVLEWKPSRWLDGLSKEVLDARIPGVYANTLTFSAGGRACIGFKFAQMEMKMVLSRVLTTFTITPGREVTWSIGGISKPTPLKASKPAMPLNLSLIPERTGAV